MRELRRLPLEGMPNCRELGGYAAMEGGRTAYGRFIRSEMPHALTAADIQYLRNYGVTLSIDFRGQAEVDRYPSPLAELDWVEYARRPVFNEQVAQGAMAAERPVGGITVAWGDMYIDMAERYKPWFKAVLELAAGCSGAVHYHCTTGKDRTGLISMALLGICGVSDLDIIADYAVSQIYLRPMFQRFREIVPQAPEFDLDDPFFRTEPKNMEALLEHIHSAYGTVEDYVRACGVGDQTIAAIRGKLVE